MNNVLTLVLIGYILIIVILCLIIVFVTIDPLFLIAFFINCLYKKNCIRGYVYIIVDFLNILGEYCKLLKTNTYHICIIDACVDVYVSRIKINKLYDSIYI